MTGAELARAIDEPLVESAPLARRLAAEHCRPDCAAYHGVWQTLRLLGLVSTVRASGPFLVESFRALARRGAVERVLICGAADYSMLAHLLWAFAQESRVPDVTVLDLCETPLVLNRWYAERAGVAVASRRADALQFEAERCFDLVCTHSFLARFSPEERPQLVSAWSRWLRPGGKLVTAQRVRPSRPGRWVYHSPTEAAEFAERARKEAERRGSGLDAPPEQVHVEALRYAERRRRQPLRSDEELRALFTDAGFRLDRFSPDGEAERRSDRPAGPPDARSRRVGVVATLGGSP